ncbi:MAG TPA: type II toxin-antitoxin system VapC family toxin [Phenylobacterium sp.]|uniref:type II toxin-antitoxin system VapC family toxin n=1 Tax=Phenylobacterium sp. TaxID=1871053 RepID=UPI002B4811C0|nr:type II toxin-antitoxin system VapC family toxin [Phenylobacterium sp.]HKR90107.1 type II toxin-antitoxin system VapC family toxin [Phenylobacterium sp.]
MAEAVLDASAVLAMVRNEPGGEHVREVLPRAVISAVNYAEIVTKLIDHGVSDSTAAEVVGDLDLEVVMLDAETAMEACLLRESTRRWGLSLGDRACLALARARGLPAVTADRSWASVDVGVEIVLIR